MSPVAGWEDSSGEDSEDSDESIILRELGTWETVKAWRQRFVELDIGNVKIFDNEQQQLCKGNKQISLSSMQYICWRRTLLWWASCFYFVKLVMEVMVFETDVQMLKRSYSEQVIWGNHLGEYAQFFRGVVWIETSWGLAAVVSGILAQFWCVKAALQWKSFFPSVKLLSIAWVLICGLPWAWALLEPMAFTLSLSARGIQQHICEDILEGNISRLQPVLDLVSFDLGSFAENSFDGLASMWKGDSKIVCDDPLKAYTAIVQKLDKGNTLDQGQLENTKLVLKLIFAERTWDTFFGMLYISKSRLSMLFPTLLGLLFGVIKGSGIARTIVPYSRIPGLLMGCGVVFTAPFLIVLVVTANALEGNIWQLFGLVCLLAALLVVNMPFEAFGTTPKDPWALMAPVSHESVMHGTTYRGRLGIALYINAAIFIVLGIFFGEVARLKLELGKDSLLEVLGDGGFWSTLLSQLTGIVFTFLLTTWTITSITQVVFTDWVLCLVLLIDGDALTSRPGPFQEEKEKLLQQLSDEL